MSTADITEANENAFEQFSESLTISKYFQVNYDFLNSSEEELRTDDSDSEDEKPMKSYGLNEDDVSDDEELFDDDLSEEEEEQVSAKKSDEEQSEYESDYDDDSDSKPYGPDWYKKPQFRKGPPLGYNAQNNKFLKSNQAADSDYSSSDEDSDDEYGKNKVRSAREKAVIQMFKISKKIDSAELTNDFEKIVELFDNAMKSLAKFQQQNNQAVPNIALKILIQTQEAIEGYNEDESINKTKNNTKAFVSLKIKHKKSAKEFQDYIDVFNKSRDSIFNNEQLLSEDAKSVYIDEATLKQLQEDKQPKLVSKSVQFFTKFNVLLESRGKKNSTIAQQMESIVDLMENYASDVYEKILCYMNLITLRFESTKSLTYQPVAQWKTSLKEIETLFDILEENFDEYIISEVAVRSDFIDDKETLVNPKTGKKEILGSLFAYVENLSSEFIKSLLYTSFKSSEYVDRLRDEQAVYNLILRLQLYLEKTLPEEKAVFYLSRVLVLRLDYIYFKPNGLISLNESQAWDYVDDLKLTYKSQFQTGANTETSKLIDSLVEIINTNKDAKLLNFWEKANLYKIYYHSLNDDFNTSVSLMEEFSKVFLKNKSIDEYDLSVQILFNRVVVQLGFSSFKNCLFHDSQSLLHPVSIAGSLKYLMGQKLVNRYVEYADNETVDDEIKFEEVHLPYHKHIDLTLVDSVYLTCSMLNDIPSIASRSRNYGDIYTTISSPKGISKKIASYERYGFHAPAETESDFIIHCAKELLRGEWKTGVELFSNTNAWKLFQDEDMKAKLIDTMKRQSLKAYFFYVKVFAANISITKLSTKFELSIDVVTEILEEVIEKANVNANLNKDKNMIYLGEGPEMTGLESAHYFTSKAKRYRREAINKKYAKIRSLIYKNMPK